MKTSSTCPDRADVGGVFEGHRREPAGRAEHPRYAHERGDPPLAEHARQLPRFAQSNPHRHHGGLEHHHAGEGECRPGSGTPRLRERARRPVPLRPCSRRWIPAPAFAGTSLAAIPDNTQEAGPRHSRRAGHCESGGGIPSSDNRLSRARSHRQCARRTLERVRIVRPPAS